MEGKKDGKPHSLLTKEHFAEMIRFENWFMHELEHSVPRPNETYKIVTFDDLCEREKNETKAEDEAYWAEKCKAGYTNYCVVPINKCYQTPRPLDFIYDRQTNTYNIDQFRTDEELVLRI